jgi:hypothetical protein
VCSSLVIVDAVWLAWRAAKKKIYITPTDACRTKHPARSRLQKIILQCQGIWKSPLVNSYCDGVGIDASNDFKAGEVSSKREAA